MLESELLQLLNWSFGGGGRNAERDVAPGQLKSCAFLSVVALQMYF